MVGMLRKVIIVSLVMVKGLYSINNFLYVAHFNVDLIEIYNLNLVFDSTIQIMMPWAISGYINQIFVGNGNGDIFLILYG
jgi:hypothetical protein